MRQATWAALLQGRGTAQITRTACFYYGCGSPPTVTVTVASSDGA